MSVLIFIHSLHQPKRDWLLRVLQDMSMTKLSKYSNVQAIHVYCDGSVNDSRSGCGLFILRLHLYALQSTSPMNCDPVDKCLDLIHALEGAGATVHFTWIPSHVGVLLNEKALLNVSFKTTQWTLALSRPHGKHDLYTLIDHLLDLDQGGKTTVSGAHAARQRNS
ncbi:hypothetical protein E2C01_080648 [Portunus trituberculatus]|uniref:RNase H type-1 domain-containing protein n=1 Tax=Portunus trituberculatus TaxID=210409 RepID=A0A5B7IMR5_PORTR|nr:hypothetical protein [Portunus trituberculatus]